MGKLSAISPFGPIFGKELRTTARRKRTYFLRFLYLLVLFLVMLAVYSGTSYRSEDSLSVAERAQHEAELGTYFFAAFAMFSIFALPIISPVLTATAISSERLGKTLPVLLMTPITSWQIISGKLISRLLASLTLIGLSLPVLAVVRLLGGVQLGDMLSVLAVCVVASLTAAAIGLFYSTFMNRAYAVILLSYGTMLILYLFIPFALGLILVANGRGAGARLFGQILLAINPFVDVFATVTPMGMMFRSPGPWSCIIVHLCFTGLLIVWSALVLRRQARRQGESAASVAPETYIPYAVPALPPPVPPLPGVAMLPPPPPPPPGLAYAAAALPVSKQVATRSVSDNPILWREIRRPLMAKRWQAITGTLVCVGLLLATYVLIAAASSTSGSNALAEGELQIGYAFVFCGLFTVLVCVLSATTIAGEKESDTWTVLLATPVSGRDIVVGKILGTLRRLMWPSALFVGHFLIFTLFGVIPISAFILICWIVLTFNSIWIATGMYFSLRLRAVTFAVILNLLMPVAAYLLVFILTLILGNLILEGRGTNHLVEFVGLYVPYTYLGEGISVLAREYSGRSYNYGPDTHSFWVATMSERVTKGEFFAYVFGVGLAYLALSAMIVWRMVLRFDRTVGRARQAVPLRGVARR